MGIIADTVRRMLDAGVDHEQIIVVIASMEKKPKPKDDVLPALPDWVPIADWDAWLEVRRQKRAKMTARAMELSLQKLLDWKNQGHSISLILQYNVMNGNQGLFLPPVKTIHKTRSGVVMV